MAGAVDVNAKLCATARDEAFATSLHCTTFEIAVSKAIIAGEPATDAKYWNRTTKAIRSSK